MDNGSGTSGYWFTYADAYDGGASSIVWPTECPNFLSEEECDAESIKESQGVALSFTLDKGTLTYNPFVGVGFNIAGQNEEMGNPEAADASSWGGLCVAYTSTEKMTLELALGDEMEVQIGYDRPSIELPAAVDGNVKCSRWSSFAKWGAGTDPTEAVKKLVSVRFKIQGENGTKGEFNIMSVGSYVEQGSSEISSSSVKPTSSAATLPSFSSENALRVPAGGVFSWTGVDDGEQIITGLDNGTETSGWWYTYTDNYDDGASYIKLAYEQSDFQIVWEPIIELYGGVSAKFELKKNKSLNKPFVGLGFNVAGEDNETHMPVAGDASAWGGLCVAYASTHDISLELGFGEAKDQEIGYDNPSAKLPKSEEGAVKCIPWNSFNKAGLGSDITEATKKLVAVKFKFVGEDKDKGEFNIMSVGSYVKQ